MSGPEPAVAGETLTEAEAKAGEVWQEADKVLLLCIEPGVWWGDFRGERVPWDAPLIARPLRRLLDSEGNLDSTTQRADLTARLADADVIEAALAAHWEIDVDNGGDRTEFYCDGCKATLLVGTGDVDAAHRAHVAAAVRAALTDGATP